MALTCVVGKTKINTFEYDKEKIREFSNKGILKCECCGDKMIYKHGDFKIPHFAHVNKDCDYYYNEPETDEHIYGKVELYNWLKTQDVNNLELESWIPETKQRPDIYFEKNGERYVIEFQCTPIATEFNNRHELYGLNGIKDIWVLGYDKFDFNSEFYCSGDILNYNTKAMERELLDLNSMVLHFDSKHIIPFLSKGMCTVTDVVRYDIISCKINIYDLVIDDFLNGNIFYETIEYAKKARMNSKVAYIKFRDILQTKKHYKFIEGIFEKMSSSGFSEIEPLIFTDGDNKIKFSVKYFAYLGLLNNKTCPFNAQLTNYIVGDKIVTITSSEHRVFWNYNKKSRRKIPSDAWYVTRIVQDINNFDIDLLMKSWRKSNEE